MTLRLDDVSHVRKSEVSHLTMFNKLLEPMGHATEKKIELSSPRKVRVTQEPGNVTTPSIVLEVRGLGGSSHWV
jgi:hypothetical protein